MLDPPGGLPHQFGVGEAEGVTEVDGGQFGGGERLLREEELVRLDLYVVVLFFGMAARLEIASICSRTASPSSWGMS